MKEEENVVRFTFFLVLLIRFFESETFSFFLFRQSKQWNPADLPQIFYEFH